VTVAGETSRLINRLNRRSPSRRCFSEQTWRNHWLPNLFQRDLPPQALIDIESPRIRAEHERFQAIKARTDREFWTEILHTEPPPGVA
jgi:hypothetical protein